MYHKMLQKTKSNPYVSEMLKRHTKKNQLYLCVNCWSTPPFSLLQCPNKATNTITLYYLNQVHHKITLYLGAAVGVPWKLGSLKKIKWPIISTKILNQNHIFNCIYSKYFLAFESKSCVKNKNSTIYKIYT